MSIRESLILQAKYLRHTLRRLEKRASGIDLQTSPVLFANSFPKSGTHLLTQIMAGFQQIGAAVDSGLPAVVMYEGASGRERSIEEIRADLHRFRPGDIGYGHLHARPEILSTFSEQGWCGFFILRDPRDVVVSHVHYVTDMEPNHVHHEYYAHTLTNFEDRLRTSILGRPDSDAPFPDIAGRFAPFLPWLTCREVLVLKYEDLLESPIPSINKIIDHARSRGFKLKIDQALAASTLAGMIDPKRSPTFRQGKSGGWRKSFTPEMTAIFKEVTGDLLQKLQYEKDHDWAA